MKAYKELFEDLYEDDKKFQKAYDEWHDAMTAMHRSMKKNKADKGKISKFRKVWDDMEIILNEI